jgi:hypothetical protein
MKKQRYETSAKLAFYSLIAIAVFAVVGLLITNLK